MKKGDRFGQLVVLKTPQKCFDCGQRQSFVLQAVLVQCDCGEIKEVWVHHLQAGRVRSCGCLRKELSRARATKHGMRNTRLYQTWQNMLRRCEDVTSAGYEYCGARGVVVCEDWHEFESFAKWALSHGYADDLVIDRINNECGYSPSNCHFSTWSESAKNRRVTWGKRVRRSDGCVFRSVREAARQVGVSYVNILRVCHGKRKTSAGFGWTFIEEDASDD